MFSELSPTFSRLEGGIEAGDQRVQRDQGCGGPGMQLLVLWWPHVTSRARSL